MSSPTTNFVQWCIDAYTRLIAVCMPIVFFIGACNMAINILINAAFHGKLHIGGEK